ncbi:MAG TPA: histidine phosphatase family protein [Gaiellaceae bacterium]|nr:histidine phosphatase family protein [Gaiellaceae bacterium]
MRLFVIARHAQSLLNIERRVNGDPGVDVPLTDQGELEARLLGMQVAQLPLDACVHTRFPRTRMTAEIALGERDDVPFVVEPLLDDIDIGELDGATLEDYRAWKHAHPRDVPFPGGESLDDAARRYGAAFRRLLASRGSCVLVVCHEIPLRYALNAAAGSDSLDGPAHEIGNALPFLFDDAALERAVAGIERIAGKIAA